MEQSQNVSNQSLAQPSSGGNGVPAGHTHTHTHARTHTHTHTLTHTHTHTHASTYTSNMCILAPCDPSCFFWLFQLLIRYNFRKLRGDCSARRLHMLWCFLSASDSPLFTGCERLQVVNDGWGLRLNLFGRHFILNFKRICPFLTLLPCWSLTWATPVTFHVYVVVIRRAIMSDRASDSMSPLA